MNSNSERRISLWIALFILHQRWWWRNGLGSKQAIIICIINLKVTSWCNFLLMKKENWLLFSFHSLPFLSTIKRQELCGRKTWAADLGGITNAECKSISHLKSFIKLFDISFKIGWIHNQNTTSQIQAFKLLKMPLFPAHFAKLSGNFLNYLTIPIILNSLI